MWPAPWPAPGGLPAGRNAGHVPRGNLRTVVRFSPGPRFGGLYKNTGFCSVFGFWAHKTLVFTMFLARIGAAAKLADDLDRDAPGWKNMKPQADATCMLLALAWPSRLLVD